MDARGATALLRASQPERAWPAPRAAVAARPVLLDSALQVQVLWARLQWDVTLLPAEIGSYVRDRRCDRGEPVRHELRIRPRATPPLCHADHWFFGSGGRLLALLEDVVGVGTQALNRLAGARRDAGHERSGTQGVAIIGMACLFPGAPDVDAYWRNILGKVDATTDPPPEAWDPDVYYDPEFTDTDRTYCKRGGYLGAMAAVRPAGARHPAGGRRRRARPVAGAAGRARRAGRRRRTPTCRRRSAPARRSILGKGTYLNGGNAIAVQRGLVVGQTLDLIRRLHPEHSERRARAAARASCSACCRRSGRRPFPG